jgi:DNA helicase-4
MEFIRVIWLGRLFGNITHISFDKSGLNLLRRKQVLYQYQWSDIAEYPKIKRGIFASTIRFKHTKHINDIRFLNQSELSRFEDKLKEHITFALSQNIDTCLTHFRKYTVDEYLRDSNIDALNQALIPIASAYQSQTKDWEENLPRESLQQLEEFVRYMPLASNVEVLRQKYEENVLTTRQLFYDNVESKPLTQEQRLAVIRDNDRNLVLAAAGTGKTSVMVAKALDLIDRQVTKPENILILAYNKAAASELHERFIARCANLNLSIELAPQIMTFHGLGRQILSSSKTSVRISKFCDDPIKLEMWLSEWFLERMANDPKFMQTFTDLSYQPIDPFDFNSKEEYDAYIRDNEYRTLQGERVKGYQELLIANWLFINGIEYEYEPRYLSKRRIEIGFDYSPDFYLVSADVYLEHFGISRDGKTRPDIDPVKYNQDMVAKRALHVECGTTLIETYHYNWTEGELETTLEQHMLELEIQINPRSAEEVFAQLKNNDFLFEGIRRYLKCLQAIRVEQLTDDEIYERLSVQKIANAKKYKILLADVHLAYKKELAKQKAIDFDDMIIQATAAIKNEKYTPKWTHILVDEFQDISGSRMAFLQQLIDKGDSPRLTVVGDDWQSIYRFAGGKLELTTQFERRVGSCSMTKLQKTFRYNNSIADTAGKFVMENPEQYKKDVVTHTQVDSPQVYLLDSLVDGQESLALKVFEIVNHISKKDPNASIAVLARYRYLLSDAKSQFARYKTNRDIKFWTFHGAKGLEADYCILIGFFRGKTGFPNNNKEEAVVEALLPSLDPFPHSEERRLLYVGITRARKKCYLIADPMAPSEFIDELLSPQYGIQIASKHFKEEYRKIFKCPHCSEGYFKLRKGKFGDFYICTSGEVCPSKPRMCGKCGAPSIDSRDTSKCNNIHCATTAKICSKCGRPMKRRQGKYGDFWGCSGYRIKDDQCHNTSKASVFIDNEL